MTRPAGEIRRKVLKTAWDLAMERATHPLPGVTQHDVMARLVPAGVARRTVKWTWENLTRAGQLQPVGKARSVPGSPRPLQPYMPVTEPRDVACQAAELGAVLRAWVR